MPKTIITFDVELTEEEIKKGKCFLDNLLEAVYTAGECSREMFELINYPTFDAAFEAFMKEVGLEC